MMLPIWAKLRELFDGAVLHHGQYPMQGRPKMERHPTVAAAKRAVFQRYADEVGWWFSISRNGREVWSSDHEIAALAKARGEHA